VIRRLAATSAALLGAGALSPSSASAHAIVQRSDLPIPEWLFGWAAAVVLVASFVALATLWPEPRLQEEGWRPLPGVLSRVLTSRAIEILCGGIGVFLLGVVVWSGLDGVQTVTANFAPTFVYVVLWVGLVPASVLLGDVLKAFNPWRAIGRAVAWIARAAARTDMPAPLPYPSRLGRWPAAVGIVIFVALELQVISNGTQPQTVAIATLVYSALTFVAMALYGVDAWIERGETFSVYYNLFSRLSVFERRDDRIGLRKPLSGLTSLDPLPGTAPLLAAMIGTVTFDGVQEAPVWTGLAPDISDFFRSLGLSPEHAVETSFAIGLLGCVLIVYGFYRLGIVGARSVGGGFSTDRLAGVFVHTLVPIALVYVVAHYMTLLLFQGQAVWFLASDPLGRGADYFGTANRAIDYGVIGATATWYWQVGFVVSGHVAGLTLAHDRALAVYDRARLAVRSQYWMLAIMVGFTSLALWLLASLNA
jgi:hypothetical protein